MLTFEQTDGGVVLYDNGNAIAAFEPSLNAHPIYDLENNRQLVMLTKSVNPANSRDSYVFNWEDVDLAACSPPIVAPDFNTFIKELRNFFKRASSGSVGGTVTWSNVTGKPTTFPPTAHNHTFNDLSDLLANTILGNNTAGSTKAIQLTIEQVKTMLNLVVLSQAEAELGIDDEKIASILKVSQWFIKNWSLIIDDLYSVVKKFEIKDTANTTNTKIEWSASSIKLDSLKNNNTEGVKVTISNILGIIFEVMGKYSIKFGEQEIGAIFSDLRTEKLGIEYDFSDYSFFTPNTLITKKFAEELAQGFKTKDPVIVLTDVNTVLSGIQTIQSIAGFDGMRVGVKSNTTGSQNGIYIMRSGAWERSSDANVGSELLYATFLVLQGTHANETWKIANSSIPTIDVTAITITQVSAAGTTNFASITGNASDNASLSALVNLRILATAIGAENGVAPLDANSFLPETNFPLDKRKPQTLTSFGAELTYTRNSVYFTRSTPIIRSSAITGIIPTQNLTGAVEGCWNVIFHLDTTVDDSMPNLGNYTMFGAYVKGMLNRITYFYLGGELNMAVDQPNVPMTAIASGLLTEFPLFTVLYQGLNVQPLFAATALRNYNIVWRKYADASKNSPVQLQTGSRFINNSTHDITVDLCAITNITLSGSPTIDGVSSLGRTVLLIGQTNKAEQGVYQNAGGVWTRLTSMDGGVEYNGKTIYISGGTAEKGKSFQAKNRYPAIIWGTTELLFEEITFERILLSTDSAYVGYELEVTNGLGQQANNELSVPILFKTVTNVTLGTKSAANSDVISTESSGFGTANDIDVVTGSGTRANSNMQISFANSIQSTTDYHEINFAVLLESIGITANSKFVSRVNSANMNDIHLNGTLRSATAPSTTECCYMDNNAGTRPAIATTFIVNRWLNFRAIIRKTDSVGAYSLAFRLDNVDVTTASKLKIVIFDKNSPTTVRTIKRIAA